MRLDPLLLGLWLPLMSPPPASERAGLTLETGSPDALCPELTRAREAVTRRLGALEVQGGAGWRARYTIGHAPEGQPRDFIRLELFDPEGTLRLSRDLPIEGESCAAMADVIALVLDRYFRSLDPEHHDASPAEPAASPSSAPLPASPSAPLPASPSAPLPASPSTQPLPEPRLGFLAAELGVTSRPLSPTGGLRVVSELAGQICVGAAVSMAFLSQTESAPLGGDVTARAASLRAFLGWSPRFARVRPYVGPSTVLVLERGSSIGLEREETHVRALWGFGLGAGVAAELGGPWILSASAAGEALIPNLGGTFEVEGEEVLRPPALVGWLGIGVGYAFSP